MEVSASRGWGARGAEEVKLGLVKEAWSEMTVAHSSGMAPLAAGSKPREIGVTSGLWVSGLNGSGGS